MSKIKLLHLLCGHFLLLFCLLFLLACGRKDTGNQATEDDNVHVNFVVRASTMLLGVTDAQISEITIQRLNCPVAGEPVDYQLKFIPSDKMFVLNEQRAVIEGCDLRVRKVTVIWKELQVEYSTFKEQQTSAQTFETVLANPSKNAFLNVVMPYKLSVAVERNVFWSMNVSYTDSKSILFPIVAEAREASVKPLGLSISSLEDRGVVNSIWREFGVSLSCGAVQSLGTCNAYELMGLRARIVKQSDVDIGVAEQIRFQGSTNNLLFTAGLTHLLGSGLRFTIAMPLAYFGEKLYLILTRGQGYTVFDLRPELIPAAPQ
ncbi:MAG: hypothetical protein RLZZ488_1905 [Pseudomonadota bacterium]|jgi:hypothetical protein